MREFGEKIEGFDYCSRPGSYGIIIANNRVGVIKSKVSDKYFLVGGGIDDGESETEALRREAFEEIGFEIEILEKNRRGDRIFLCRKRSAAYRQGM